jgi:hypothetical protein
MSLVVEIINSDCYLIVVVIAVFVIVEIINSEYYCYLIVVVDYYHYLTVGSVLIVVVGLMAADHLYDLIK